ncbi:MAG: hypothetical protein AAFX09_02540 [Pseudomonadota bacterium]
MTDPASDDALDQIWRDSPPVDIDGLVGRMARQNRLLRRVNLASFALTGMAALVLVGIEFAQILPTRGILGLLLFAMLVFAWHRYTRDRERLARAFSTEPAKLIEFLMGRTRAMIILARLMYLAPLTGLGAGFATARLVGGDAQLGASTPPAWLWGVMAAGLVLSIMVTGFGIWLARSRAGQLRVLAESRAALGER